MSGWKRLVALVENCSHAGVLAGIRPMPGEAWAEDLRSGKFRAICPDCSWELDVRCWCPEAGGWYLYLQERLAAGRKWYYRREGERWVAGL